MSTSTPTIAYPESGPDYDLIRAGAAWASLEQALKHTPLPDGQGSEVSCDVDDFMLMYFDSHGTAYFKNAITRNYLMLTAQGEMVFGSGGPFRECAFAHAA